MREWISEYFAGSRRTEASEALAVSTLDSDNSYTQVFEITVNLNENLPILEYINVYKELWEHLLEQYKVVDRQLYFIEYCKSGKPHLHGYMEVRYHIETLFALSDQTMLRNFARTIYLKLPTKYWKQFKNKLKYNSAYRKLKAPAICLSLNNIVSTNWENYIKKNAPNAP